LLPAEVESLPAGTDRDGIVATVSGLAGWADHIVVCGDDALVAAVAARLRAAMLRKRVTALVERPLPCGTGFCAGCPIVTRRRVVSLACRDGPAFELRDLI
jgi:hypothetical protein